MKNNKKNKIKNKNLNENEVTKIFGGKKSGGCILETPFERRLREKAQFVEPVINLYKNKINKNVDRKNINEKEIQKISGGQLVDLKTCSKLNIKNLNLLVAYGGPKLIAPNLTTEKFKLKKQENNKNINTNFTNDTEDK